MVLVIGVLYIFWFWDKIKKAILRANGFFYNCFFLIWNYIASPLHFIFDNNNVHD